MPVAEVHVNWLAERVDVVTPRHATAQGQIKPLALGRTKPSLSRDGRGRNHCAPGMHVRIDLDVKEMISRGFRVHPPPAMPVSQRVEGPTHKECPRIQGDIEHSQTNQHQGYDNHLSKAAQPYDPSLGGECSEVATLLIAPHALRQFYGCLLAAARSARHAKQLVLGERSSAFRAKTGHGFVSSCFASRSGFPNRLKRAGRVHLVLSPCRLR